MILRTFRWSFLFTVVALVAGLLYGGVTGMSVVAILMVLEISLSFDNAVVNAKIVSRLSDAWQRVFLTVGVIIAVFGMRIIFPLVIVGITAKLTPIEAVRLALEKGSVDQAGSYANLLAQAHPAIAAFGGMFLLLLFLDWLFEDRELTWLSWLEKPLARIGRLDQLSVVVALLVLYLVSQTLAEHPATVLISGVLGTVTYLLVNGLGDLFNTEDGEPSPAGGIVRATGRAAVFLFVYLEVLDASFSFDGVIGAFAITSDPVIIALGLGVGALYIRSLTVYLVHKGTLSEYVYLEHGAHWAIGALAALLLVTIRYEVPEVVTGLIGVAFIAIAFVSSVVRNRRGGGDGPSEIAVHESATPAPATL